MRGQHECCRHNCFRISEKVPFIVFGKWVRRVGGVSLKVVGFRLRIKDRELRLIRQMIADRISCVP